MEKLCNLLFELSNEDRLRILNAIDKEATNVTNLSNTLGLTTQECSRHVSRLSKARLTSKDVEGLHHLTPYGELILKQLEGLKFISQHSSYFISHTLAGIPPEFIFRIGELAETTYVDDVMVTFFGLEKLLQKAEEYVWTITDQYLADTIPLFRKAVERGVRQRNIEPKDYYRYHYQDEDRKAFERLRIAGLLEERVVDRLHIHLYMSEKEVAGISFPLLDGRFDYLGFTSKDQESHKWCKDLFLNYWERAPTRVDRVEELYRWVKKSAKAIHALRRISAGKDVANEKEIISELERMGLVKQRKLTLLGELVYERL